MFEKSERRLEFSYPQDSGSYVIFPAHPRDAFFKRNDQIEPTHPHIDLNFAKRCTGAQAYQLTDYVGIGGYEDYAIARYETVRRWDSAEFVASVCRPLFAEGRELLRIGEEQYNKFFDVRVPYILGEQYAVRLRDSVRVYGSDHESAAHAAHVSATLVLADFLALSEVPNKSSGCIEQFKTGIAPKLSEIINKSMAEHFVYPFSILY